MDDRIRKKERHIYSHVHGTYEIEYQMDIFDSRIPDIRDRTSIWVYIEFDLVLDAKKLWTDQHSRRIPYRCLSDRAEMDRLHSRHDDGDDHRLHGIVATFHPSRQG